MNCGYFYAPYLPLTSTPIINPKKFKQIIDKEMAEVIMIALMSAEHESLLPGQEEAVGRLTKLVENYHPDVAKEFKNE